MSPLFWIAKTNLVYFLLGIYENEKQNFKMCEMYPKALLISKCYKPVKHLDFETLGNSVYKS